MAWIKTVADHEATGPLKALFQAASKRAGHVFNIVRVMSPNPQTLRASIGFYQAAMFRDSPLSRALRELLAVIVSKTNRCDY